MKKFLSLIMAGMMVMGISVPVYGQVLERARFMAAMSNTYNRLGQEMEPLMAHQRDSFQVLNQLVRQAYEMQTHISLEGGGFDFLLDQQMQIDNTRGIYRLASTLQGLGGLLPGMDVSMSIYVDDEMVAVQNPASPIGAYLYLSRGGITPQQWEESALAQQGILYFEDLSDILGLIDQTIDETINQIEAIGNMNMDFPESTADAMSALTRRHIFEASFSSQQDVRVPSSASNFVTERITATLQEEQVSAYFEELAELVLSDAELLAWIEGMMPEGHEDIAQEIIFAISEVLLDIAWGFSGPLHIHAYIASHGLVVRQVLEFPGMDDSIYFYMNLLGRDFLINEFAVGVVADNGSYESAGLSLRITGDNFFENGILDTRQELLINNIEGISAVLAIDYFLDMNQLQDNFTLDISLDVDYAWFPLSLRASGSGTYVLDTDTNTVYLNMIMEADLDSLMPGAGTGSLTLRSIMQPLAQPIAAPGSLTNILDTTFEELMMIFDSF